MYKKTVSDEIDKETQLINNILSGAPYVDRYHVRHKLSKEAQLAIASINDLMVKNKVTIDDIYHCVEQYEDEIDNMVNIFDFNTKRDQRLAVLTMRLLGKEQGNAISKYYSKHVHRLPLGNPKNFSKEEVILVLTACLYNGVFYSQSLRFCDLAKEYLGK